MAPKKRMLTKMSDPTMISSSFDENTYEALTWYENDPKLEAVQILEVRAIEQPNRYRRKKISWKSLDYVSKEIGEGFYRQLTYEMMVELEKETKRTNRSRKTKKSLRS